MCLSLGYPDAGDEVEILQDSALVQPLEEISAVMEIAGLAQLQREVRQVEVEESVLDYIVRLVRRTRGDVRLRLGASPRGSLDLRRCAQARAWLAARDHVRPEDVQAMAGVVLVHRLLVDIKAGHGGIAGSEIVEDALAHEAVPQ